MKLDIFNAGVGAVALANLARSGDRIYCVAPGRVMTGAVPGCQVSRPDPFCPHKCRQEYVDFGISLAEVPKSTFTAGLHPHYSKQVRDCYAYIYPAVQAQKVDRLIAAGYHPVVTSGYRSPRHNIFYASSTANSTHIYGEAVDISPLTRDAEGWKELWVATQTTCAKSLELTPKKVMLGCWDNEVSDYEWGAFPKGVTPENYDEMVYGKATCIHLGNPQKTMR